MNFTWTWNDSGSRYLRFLAGILLTQIFLVSAGEVDDAIGGHFDNACGQGGYELAVMADEDQRARIVFQRQIQSLDGLHVQVVYP